MLADLALPKLANMNATAPKHIDKRKHARPATNIFIESTSSSTILDMPKAVRTPAIVAMKVINAPTMAMDNNNLDLEIGLDSSSSIVPSRSSLPIKELPSDIDRIPSSIGSIR